MASRGMIAREDRRSHEEIAAKDRKQSDVNSRRQLLGSVITAGAKLAAAKSGGSKASQDDKVMKRLKRLSPEAYSKFQHPEWYKKWLNPDLFASYPSYRNMLNKLAALATIGASMDSSTYSIAQETSDPYVVGLLYGSRLGSIEGANSADNYLNFPANAMWVKDLNELAKVNSRAVNQDSDVLGLYIMACAEVVKLLGWVKTNIEITSNFNPEQSKLRDALLLARCRGNATMVASFKNDKAGWKKTYNIYASRFNAELPIPSDVSLLERRAWVSTSIIKDHDLNKAQYITFIPRSMLVLNTDADGLTSTDHLSVASRNNIEALLEQMIDAIATDVDMQTLIGNIRAAVSNGSFYMVPEEVADEYAFIEADHHALHQFHNLVTFPEFAVEQASSTTFNSFEQILSDGQTLYQSRTFNVTSSNVLDAPSATAANVECNTLRKASTLLDFYTDDIVPDEVLEASRLHTIYEVTLGFNTDSSSRVGVKSLDVNIKSEGTEVIYSCWIYDWNSVTKQFVLHKVYTYNNLAYYDFVGTTTFDEPTYKTTLTSKQSVLATASRIDWLFQTYWASTYDDTNSVLRASTVTSMWETDRTVLFARDPFFEINRMALYSLYYSDPKIFSKNFIK